jgi:hypothetical protein
MLGWRHDSGTRWWHGCDCVRSKQAFKAEKSAIAEQHATERAVRFDDMESERAVFDMLHLCVLVGLCGLVDEMTVRGWRRIHWEYGAFVCVCSM